MFGSELVRVSGTGTGTLISKSMYILRDIDIKNFTVSHSHHIACNCKHHGSKRGKEIKLETSVRITDSVIGGKVE